MESAGPKRKRDDEEEEEEEEECYFDSLPREIARIVFDYFVPENRDSYRIILASVCKKWKELVGGERVTLHLKRFCKIALPVSLFGVFALSMDASNLADSFTTMLAIEWISKEPAGVKKKFYDCMIREAAVGGLSDACFYAGINGGDPEEMLKGAAFSGNLKLCVKAEKSGAKDFLKAAYHAARGGSVKACLRYSKKNPRCILPGASSGTDPTFLFNEARVTVAKAMANGVGKGNRGNVGVLGVLSDLVPRGSGNREVANYLLHVGIQTGRYDLCRSAWLMGATCLNLELLNAAVKGDGGACALLKEMGATDPGQMLLGAAEKGSVELCEVALAWIDERGGATISGNFRVWKLQIFAEAVRRAATGGHASTCALVLKRAAEIGRHGSRGRHGLTTVDMVSAMIRIGAARGHLGVCELAASSGATPKDFDLMLWEAAKRGDVPFCKRARELGATDADVTLTWGAFHGHEDVCELALEWGAKDFDRMLRLAAEGGRVETCRMARRLGASDARGAIERLGVARDRFDLDRKVGVDATVGTLEFLQEWLFEGRPQK